MILWERRPRRDSRRGGFRVLLTPLTYIPVGDGAPTDNFTDRPNC